MSLLVLDPADCAALTLNGGLTLTVHGGNVQVDSNASKSAGPLCATKDAAIKSGAGAGGLINVDGTNNVVGSGDSVGITPAWTENATYQPDPLTRVQVPPFDNSMLSPAGPGKWDVPKVWDKMGTATAGPGVYWGGINVGTGDTLTLTAGTYIIAGGGFNMTGNGTVTATGGVTFIYTKGSVLQFVRHGPARRMYEPRRKERQPRRLASRWKSRRAPGSLGGGFWGTTTSAIQPQVLSPDPYSLTNILIYVDRNALAQDGPPSCPNTTLNVGGGGYFNFATGSIIYTPCSVVDLHGNSDPPSHGGAVVSWQAIIAGTKDFTLGGPDIGGQPMSQSNLVQ